MTIVTNAGIASIDPTFLYFRLKLIQMNMLTRNLLALCFLIPFVNFAQSDMVEVDWGPEYKSKTGISYLVEANDDGYIARTYEKRNAALTFFTWRMVPSKTEVIDLDFGVKDRSLEAITSFGGQIIVFSSALDKDRNLNVMYLQKVDRSTLRTTSDLEEIATIAYEKKRRSGAFEVYVSEDESKLMVFYHLPFEKKGKEKFGAIVFDEDMSQMVAREIEMPYVEELFAYQERIVSNDGEVIVSGKVFQDKARNVLDDEVNYKFHVLVFGDEENDDRNMEIELEQYLPLYMRLVNDEQRIYGVGYYSELDTPGTKGLYYATLDLIQGDVDNIDYLEFDEDFVRQHMTEREERKADKKENRGKEINESGNFKIDEIIMKEDGGVLVVAEERYSYTTSYTDANGNTSYTTHYINNELALISISGDGEIEWAEKVKKFQHTTNDGAAYNSYVRVLNDKGIYFVFNDHIDNLSSDPNSRGSFNKGKKSVTVVVEVTFDGQITKEALFEPRLSKTMPMPNKSEQISDNQVLIYTTFGKKKQFAIFTVN